MSNLSVQCTHNKRSKVHTTSNINSADGVMKKDIGEANTVLTFMLSVQ